MPPYLYGFFITGDFIVFDPRVGDVVGHAGESNLMFTHKQTSLGHSQPASQLWNPVTHWCWQMCTFEKWTATWSWPCRVRSSPKSWTGMAAVGCRRLGRPCRRSTLPRAAAAPEGSRTSSSAAQSRTKRKYDKHIHMIVIGRIGIFTWLILIHRKQ